LIFIFSIFIFYFKFLNSVFVILYNEYLESAINGTEFFNSESLNFEFIILNLLSLPKNNVVLISLFIFIYLIIFYINIYYKYLL